MNFEKSINIGGKNREDELLLDLDLNKIAEILKNENEYFDFSGIDQSLEVVRAEDFFFEYDSDEEGLRKANEFSIKVFRSKQWTSQNLIDENYNHQVVYYAGCGNVLKEYAPNEIKEHIDNAWKKYKEQHSDMNVKDLEWFEDFQRALLLTSSLIEKKVLHFKNPLLIRGYKYEEAWKQKYINDLRYIKEEEINNLKEQGYDGIIFEQYNWFICFKDNN